MQPPEMFIDPRKVGHHDGNMITLGCNACRATFQVPAGTRARNARLKHLGDTTQTVSNVEVCVYITAGANIAKSAKGEYGVRVPPLLCLLWRVAPPFAFAAR